MIPDSYKKTVRIPVRFVNEELKFFYGGPLPKLKEGAIGDLIIPEYTVENGTKLDLIRRNSRKLFFKKGTTLLARLSSKSKDDSDELLEEVEVSPSVQGLYASIKLEENLAIEFRGTKNLELYGCKCSIPALNGVEASSVNHAYTLLSEKFEKHRKTHTGNVFDQVYSQNKNQKWVQLSNFRNQIYREFEYELICLCKDWWISGDASNNRVWFCIGSQIKNNHTGFDITDESEIVSEHYYRDQNEAEHWLKNRGYQKLDHNDFKESLKPPIPPYKKPSGEEVIFTL